LPLDRCRNLGGIMQENIWLYSLSTCSHCKAIKRLLGECKIEYKFTDVDQLSMDARKAILNDIKRFNPECSFPTVVIGDKVIVGYNENEIMEALGLVEETKKGFFKTLIEKLDIRR
jgi:glutaredoxin-like protein NrdH